MNFVDLLREPAKCFFYFLLVSLRRLSAYHTYHTTFSQPYKYTSFFKYLLIFKTKSVHFVTAWKSVYFMHDKVKIWFDSFPNFVLCFVCLPIFLNMFHFAIFTVVIQFSWSLTAYCFDFWLRAICLWAKYFILLKLRHDCKHVYWATKHS